MKFLLTNDDGIDAPGILTLFDVVGQFGEPVLVAPMTALSGCSHQVTTDRPIRVNLLREGRYAVDGTPSDCVRVGLLRFAADVEWVVSGINDGGNLGVDTFMSGTVSAAREAALLGRKAIAISQYRRRQLPFDWTWSRTLAAHVVQRLLRRPLPARCFWNVNLPADYAGSGPLPDVAFCPLDPHALPMEYEELDGALHYRGNYHARSRRAGTDVDVCFSGRVSVSLVSLDQA